MRRTGIALLTLLLGVAQAIEFEDFGDTNGLQLNGHTEVLETQDGTVLRLTPSEGSKAGSVFSQSPLDARSFSSAFRFRITDPGGQVFDCNETSGADGIVFVVQPVSSDLGSVGQGIGYAGIQRSVGIELDTWCNSGNRDPNSNHLGLNLRGGVQHNDLPVVSIEPDFDNGEIWHVWVDYDGSVLEVRLSQTPERPERATLHHELDIPDILEADAAFVGFTSGTGAAWGNHDILSWEYRESYAPIGLSEDGPGLLVVRRAGGDSGSGAILVILDASGSMQRTLDGRRRYQIANEVLADLTSTTLTAGTPFALRVFGNREAGSCRSDLELPLAPLDPVAVATLLETIEPQPFAGTPLAASIAQVGGDLSGVSGPKTIVLITDGEESCDGDDEAEIRALAATGIDVVLNIVGFDLDADDETAARDRFQAWAALGGGHYFDADSSEALGQSLEQATHPNDFTVYRNDEPIATGLVNAGPIELPEGTYQLRFPDGSHHDITIAGGQTVTLDLPIPTP